MKAIRETVGTCACFVCGRESQVRADKNGKLYYLCDRRADYAGCGKITPNLAGGQQALAAAMKPIEQRQAEPAPAPAAADQPAQRGKGVTGKGVSPKGGSAEGGTPAEPETQPAAEPQQQPAPVKPRLFNW